MEVDTPFEGWEFSYIPVIITSWTPSPWMKLRYLPPGRSRPLPYEGNGATKGQIDPGTENTCVALITAPLAKYRVIRLVRLKLSVK
ncbi:hypothetical protein Ccrd_002593 [Cynara cardunculus var. scolymus]|uniref:Uncharacterized protein n=1 Tax=Cynara cardunculus var. scolymus TaxID=59895 RepID=A0A103XR48_CYNCS|nr:hypothetical protein Ccrd_002593 [Cynara cardunculus var. scolymus]